MKKYLVIWRNLDTNERVVVMTTDDQKKVYSYRQTTPRNRELIIEEDGKEVFRCMRA